MKIRFIYFLQILLFVILGGYFEIYKALTSFGIFVEINRPKNYQVRLSKIKQFYSAEK